MATETAAVPTRGRPTLTGSLRVFFRSLVRGTAGGVLELRERGGRQFQRRHSIAAATAPSLDEAVLNILETSLSPWGVGLAVRKPGGPLLSVSALVVRRGDAWPTALDVLPPTLLVRCAHTYGLWALREPLPAVTPEDHSRVMDLMKGLALVVGGVAPAEDLDAIELPLPGTSVRNLEPGAVQVSRYDEARVYTIHEVEAAVAAGRK